MPRAAGRAGEPGRREPVEGTTLAPLDEPTGRRGRERRCKSTGLALAFWGLLLGALAGGLVGLLGHALAGRRRDFSSTATLDAGRYDVMAPADVAGDARRRLAVPRAA